MFQVILFVLAEYWEIIQLDNHAIINRVTEDIVQKLIEGYRSTT